MKLCYLNCAHIANDNPVSEIDKTFDSEPGLKITQPERNKFNCIIQVFLVHNWVEFAVTFNTVTFTYY